jgi:hypothetical protein
VTTVQNGAVFSPDRVYRYVLTRRWDGGDGTVVNFIGLNPSTADEQVNDGAWHLHGRGERVG